MNQAILGPNEGSRSLEAIYAAIEKLQLLGSIENWIDQRAEAEQLLDEWLDIPVKFPEDHLPPEHDPIELFTPRGVWLLYQLNPQRQAQTWSCIERNTIPKPLVVDVNEWAGKAANILIKGWQQFERFQLAEYDAHGNKIGLDGDLAEEGGLLWANYDCLDPLRVPRNLRDLPASDHHKKMPFGIVAADHKCSSNAILSAN
jgi:hypothetical protein